MESIVALFGLNDRVIDNVKLSKLKKEFIEKKFFEGKTYKKDIPFGRFFRESKYKELWLFVYNQVDDNYKSNEGWILVGGEKYGK